MLYSSDSDYGIGFIDFEEKQEQDSNAYGFNSSVTTIMEREYEQHIIDRTNELTERAAFVYTASC